MFKHTHTTLVYYSSGDVEGDSSTTDTGAPGESGPSTEAVGAEEDDVENEEQSVPESDSEPEEESEPETDEGLEVAPESESE